MKEQETPIYLHVDPYCKRRQIIHIESILGSNIVIMAEFSCEVEDGSGIVKLKEAKFEIYPMFGIYHWGFKKITPQMDSDSKKDELREIKIVLGTTNCEKEMTVSFKGVTWKHTDTIDNKMYFDVFGKEFDRKKLNKIFYDSPTMSNQEKFNIPVDDRPCQFKLVKPRIKN